MVLDSAGKVKEAAAALVCFLFLLSLVCYLYKAGTMCLFIALTNVILKYVYMYIFFYVIAEKTKKKRTATTPANRAVLQSSILKADKKSRKKIGQIYTISDCAKQI